MVNHRRAFLVSVFGGWRWHELGRLVCARGPVLLVYLRGEISKLTPRERKLLEAINQLLIGFEGAN